MYCFMKRNRIILFPFTVHEKGGLTQSNIHGGKKEGIKNSYTFRHYNFTKLFRDIQEGILKIEPILHENLLYFSIQTMYLHG